MPNIKSAQKRMKTSIKSRDGNKSVKTKVATMRGKLNDAIAAGDSAAATTAFGAYCSSLDKAVKRGTVKANTANRGKSRAAARMKKM